MKVVDDLINKISTMNLKTVPQKSAEVRIIESHMSHSKHPHVDKNEQTGEHEVYALGAYDNSLSHAIAPKITAVSRAQRRDAKSWSLGRYQAVTDSSIQLPILAYGSEAEFKTLSGKNVPMVRSSQCGMAAMSWDIKEQVLNRYALTASEQLAKHNAEYYANSPSLAEQAQAEFGTPDDFAEDCNSAECDEEMFDATQPVVDHPRIVCPLDDRNDSGSQFVTAEYDKQVSAEIIDFYRNKRDRSIRNQSTCADELIENDDFNEFADSIDEFENSLTEQDLLDLPLSQFDPARRPGMDDEPALLTLKPYEPVVMQNEKVQDWDESTFAQQSGTESIIDDFSSIDIERTGVSKLIELAQRSDTPADVLEQIARSSDFNVRWAIAGNPNTPLITIWTFVADANPAIRYLIADSSLVSSEVLEVLSEDPDPYVSARAIKTLNRLRTRKLITAQFGTKCNQEKSSPLQSTGTDGRTSELKLKAAFSRLREDL